MTLSQKRSEAITEVQRARLDALYRTGNNHAHPKEAVNASDVQALKSPRIGIGVFYPHAPLILPNVKGATGEDSIPRIAACARVVPGELSYRTLQGTGAVRLDSATQVAGRRQCGNLPRVSSSVRREISAL
jgi:hypothetical protein